MLNNLQTYFTNLGKKAIIIPITYMIIIFILSSIPDNDSTIVTRFFQQINPGIQNLLHIPLYAGLTGLWVLSLKNWNLSFKRILLWGFIISWSYSLLDEFHQYFVPGRFPGFIDVVLNTIGVIAAIIIINYRLNPKINYNSCASHYSRAEQIKLPSL